MTPIRAVKHFLPSSVRTNTIERCCVQKHVICVVRTVNHNTCIFSTESAYSGPTNKQTMLEFRPVRS